MAKAISDLINLQKHINNIEIEFDMRRMLLDHKHDYSLKEAYELRTQILMGLNGNEGTCTDSTKLINGDTLKYPEYPNNKTNGYNINDHMSVNDYSIRRQMRDGVVNENLAVKGFWYTVFANSEQFSDIIQSHDKDALSYLTNVSSSMNLSNMRSDNTFIFTLSFTFSSNPYFVNQILTKEYFVEVKIDKENPIKYYGPRIYKSIGCPIDWKTGMNLTKKTTPRRPPRRKSLTTITSSNKSIKRFDLMNDNNNSSVVYKQKCYKIKEWVMCGGKGTFFNYFSFPEIPEDVSLDSEDEALLDKDFQMGWHIKDEIIPRAFFYFIGDNLDSDSDEDSDSSISNDSSGCRNDTEISCDSGSDSFSSENSSES